MTEPQLARRGGTPRPLIAAPERLNELREGSREWPSWTLTPRQISDLELLMCGGFAPLDGFMNRAAFDSVCETMRLPSGALWPIPITLDVTPEAAGGLEAGSKLVLRDLEGLALAVLTVDDVWEHDRRKEAELVYGTLDQAHPGVAHLYQRTNTVSVGGRIEGIQPPRHYDFPGLRKTPQQLRRRFAQLGWKTAIAFQTRNPMHRAHFELTLRAARDLEANLLIHPVVGMTKPGDLDHYTRVRCYRRVLSHYPRHTAELALLPLAMRMAGPREALWHALIRRNYGCTHLIVGRDHAGPGQDSQGKPFYGPYDAQELMVEHEAELGVKMVPFRLMVYVEDRDSYEPVDDVREGERTLSISGSDLRRRLRRGLPIPDWFTFPEVARELRRSHPARSSQGFTVFFTGLSGAGKSTIANVLLVKFLEAGGRPVTLLDGDIVRTNLSSELGFSREHRDINIRRIGFVASEITKNGGIAICAPIAPYENVRQDVREMIEAGGGFILVHVATPLDVCEERDVKGLYAKARAGLIDAFTGISDPYEAPENPDMVIDTTDITAEEAAQQVILHLEKEGFVGPR
ncbi:MAG: bifunctional sulfate adenylyltransferase/adenylylsulfate kinase [Acidobacteria bacterium]|nr:bifunctional sulfate adenylyltransferase/adenylylsulfate kinase [Acidobacteriota bacterium]